MINVVNTPIEPSESFAGIAKNASGSVLLHYAVVKEDICPDGTKSTCHVEYRQNGDVAAELKMISDEIKAQWNVEDMALVRRIGCLSVNDIISMVAVSSPNSRDAFEACRHGVERLKKMTTIIKEEVFR
jgi:molybdopterin synthase catalytic subunit